jgi:hypothetical protein
MRWPNSSISSSAVSWSIVSVIVTGVPILKSALTKVGAAFAHALGEFLHGDRFGTSDVAVLLDGGADLADGRAFPFRVRGGERRGCGPGCRLRPTARG